ncbi:MAG: Hsp20/alpha crystallin family protein [Vicinamibacteria bacterium]|nr:Hsp20/alpha crystallin family protein [Vicinamibacteria bacterium]
MGVRRWDPLRDLLSMQERVNRLFDDSLSRVRLDHPELASNAWMPLADMCETSSETLIVRGQRAMDSKMDAESFQRIERSYGTFARTFRFVEPVDPARAVMRLHDGLLRIEIPKAHSKRVRARDMGTS